MSKRQPTNLIERVSIRLSEKGQITTTHPLYPPDTILQFLNNAMNEIQVMYIDTDWYASRAEFLISTIESQNYYELPKNLGRIKNVWWYSDSGSSPIEIRFVPFQHVINHIYGSGFIGTSWQNVYSLHKGKFYLPKAPGETKTNNIKINYQIRVPDMHTGTISSATSTTITFSSTPTYGEVSTSDDYYNLSEIYISSGPSAGQTRMITDYDGTTRTATLDSPLDNVPITGNMYEILAFVPEEYADVLALSATVECQEIEGQPSKFLIERQRESFVRFINHVTRQQNSQSERVRMITI